jgi:hypothetical protein
MPRRKLKICQETLSPFLVTELKSAAEEFNRKNREYHTRTFPKNPARWLSHYHFEPRRVTFTPTGEVDGGISWLVGSLFDFSFIRSIVASDYSEEGGHCFDPATLFFLILACCLDGYGDYADFCRILLQDKKGESYRMIAGIEDSVLGDDDLCNFKKRVGADTINSVMDMFVDFFRDFGLITPELVTADGQLEPSNSRYKGCAHFCDECREISITDEHLQILKSQLLSGKKTLEITCPFPDVVEKVKKATKKNGKMTEPKVRLLGVEYLDPKEHKKIAPEESVMILGFDRHDFPRVQVKWCHVTQDSSGQLTGCCPKVPSDLEARVGYHVDNKNPPKKERVFGYLNQRISVINLPLNLELPIRVGTYPANQDEGNCFFENRRQAQLPFTHGQVYPLDAGYDQTDNYFQFNKEGAIGIISYNQRNEDLSSEALLERGYDQNGVPYAPCGKQCHSNGYNYDNDSRQYVCRKQCEEDERLKCPHGDKTLGFSKKMSFGEFPRLVGPVQRGTPLWQALYNTRSASERVNSYDQEVVAKQKLPKIRGLTAFKFAGAIRTLGQLLARAINFVLNATHTVTGLAPIEG